MAVNVLANVDILISYVVPFCALFVIEPIIVIKLWGIAGVVGDFDIPVSWSTVDDKYARGGDLEKDR